MKTFNENMLVEHLLKNYLSLLCIYLANIVKFACELKAHITQRYSEILMTQKRRKLLFNTLTMMYLCE